jgi:NAD(P)H-hydrate epimerase
MQFILTPEEVRNADSIAITKFKIPSEILMENAARSSSEYIEEIIKSNNLYNPAILILCGSGNNGGDGFALARHLSRRYNVRVAWYGEETKMSWETKQNFNILKQIELDVTKLESELNINQYDFSSDIIVDALIGVGGSEKLRGIVINILQQANKQKSIKIAIDVPTGLNSLNGFSAADAFIADYTITMFAIKTGMLLNDGLSLCGKIKVAYLGAPDSIVSQISKIAYLEDEDVFSLLPQRNRLSSKFDYGRVVILAGSKRMPGAATLSANAAIRSGAGLVYLLSTEFHPALLPEVIPTKLESDKEGFISYSAKNEILKSIEKANVLAIGPGLGFNDDIAKLINEIINEVPDELPIILDADAIKSITSSSKLKKNILITPHIGEFSNLTNLHRDEVSKYVNNSAVAWAEKLNCLILLKHVPSVITDGDFSYWNIYGNPGMATAGSGDVLTGIIASFIAQGLNPIEAASLASFIHSKAGDYYAVNYSQETLTASKLIESLDYVFYNLKLLL